MYDDHIFDCELYTSERYKRLENVTLKKSIINGYTKVWWTLFISLGFYKTESNDGIFGAYFLCFLNQTECGSVWFSVVYINKI